MNDAPTPDKAPLSQVARTGLWLGPAWLLLTLIVPAPGGMPATAWHCVGLALLMATWWATEAIPIPATSLLPIVIVPMLGIEKLGATTANYGDPIIFLFLGGFLLGIAMQRWNLHRRIALRVLLLVGAQPKNQIGGFMIATGFLSMWVSNTATSIMMLPIGLSVIGLQGRDLDEADKERYATSLLLAIAYAASIGGIATLIGTPPNALLAGYLAKNHGIDVGFAQWMAIGLPVSAGMMVIAWWWLTRGGFKFSPASDSTATLRSELARLGPLSPAERRVGIIFTAAAVAWIVRPALNDAGVTWLSDTAVALIAGITLFLMPSGTGRGTRLLDWDAAQKLPWGVLLLFGGGLALASVVKSSGLAEWIATQLSVFNALPLLLLVGIVVLVIIFLTEVTSNTATAAAFLPLLGALAVSLNIDPLLVTVPAAIAASCAFMMPVATPPNAIVFATGHMKIQSMIRAGLFLNVAGTVFITFLVVGLIRMLWM